MVSIHCIGSEEVHADYFGYFELTSNTGEQGFEYFFGWTPWAGLIQVSFHIFYNFFFRTGHDSLKIH